MRKIAVTSRSLPKLPEARRALIERYPDAEIRFNDDESLFEDADRLADFVADAEAAVIGLERFSEDVGGASAQPSRDKLLLGRRRPYRAGGAGPPRHPSGLESRRQQAIGRGVDARADHRPPARHERLQHRAARRRLAEQANRPVAAGPHRRHPRLRQYRPGCGIAAAALRRPGPGLRQGGSGLLAAAQQPHPGRSRDPVAGGGDTEPPFCRSIRAPGGSTNARSWKVCGRACC